MLGGRGAGAGTSKPMARLENSLTHGNIWLSVLSIIRRKRRAYAYVLDQEIEREFGFRPNRVMVYVVLYKLEGEGLIRSSFEGRRKYYTLTASGRDALGKGRDYLAALAKRL